MLEPAPYRTDDTAAERPTTAKTRERAVFADGYVPVRLVFGVLAILAGVLVLIDTRLLPWIVGFGLVIAGLWLLVTGGYIGRPRQEPARPAEPPAWPR